jgi:hypothetical protein
MTRKQEFTAKEVCDACEGTGGIMTLVATKLGCDRTTIWRYAKRYPTVRQALRQADEAMTDVAEAKAGKLIKAEYWPAIKYRLQTKGKDRGYIERTEVTGADGGDLSVTVGATRMTELTGIFLLAVFTEATVEYFVASQIPKNGEEKTAKYRRCIPYVAAVLGVALCVVYRVDVLAMLVGMTPIHPAIGWAVSGLIVGRGGSNFLNDLVGLIRGDGGYPPEYRYRK